MRMSGRRYLWLWLCPVFLSACGNLPWNGDDNNDSGHGVRPTSAGTARNFGLYDAGCQNSNSSQQIEKQSYSSVNDLGLLEESSNSFSMMSDSSGLNAQPVESTISNQGQSLGFKAHIKKQELDLGFNYRIDSVPAPLKVCVSDTSALPAETKEAVGVTSLISLMNGDRFYRTLSNAKDMKKVVLNILPSFIIRLSLFAEKDNLLGLKLDEGQEQASGEFEMQMTDNASWSQGEMNGKDAFFITVYPQSEEARQAKFFNGAGLWQIPFVLHHEYGHHIFFRHANRTFENNAKLKNYYSPDSPFNVAIGNETLRTYKGLLAEKDPSDKLAISSTDLENAILAVNEGFADLFGHYSLGAPEKSVDAISCFAKTRNVASAYFIDGKKKDLNNVNLATFLSASSGLSLGALAGTSSCDRYTFEDVHIVGAVVAYGVDRLFQLVAKSPRDRANLSLAWLNEMDSKFSKSSTAREFLAEAVTVAAQVAEQKASDLDAFKTAKDEILNEVFSGLDFEITAPSESGSEDSEVITKQ